MQEICGQQQQQERQTRDDAGADKSSAFGRAAELMRVLYIQDLKKLQLEINRTIAKVCFPQTIVGTGRNDSTPQCDAWCGIWMGRRRRSRPTPRPTRPWAKSAAKKTRLMRHENKKQDILWSSSTPASFVCADCF